MYNPVDIKLVSALLLNFCHKNQESWRLFWN